MLKETTLRDVCSLVTDGTHDTPKIIDEGFPLIKAKTIAQGFIDFENSEKISLEDHKRVIARSKPENGDTLFVHIGASLGASVYINTNKEFSIKNVALFKPDVSKIDSRYLYYLVISPKFQNEIKGKRSGSAQPFVGLETLRSHMVSFHQNTTTQKKIASVLSAYDDLIENNTRRIAILEEMARRIYEEWFVKFRFPGHEQVKMVESELGLIPEGWKIKNLYDVAELTYGFPFKSKLFNEKEGIPVVRIRDIKPNFSNTLTPEEFNNQYVIQNGDILVGMDGIFHIGKWAGGYACLNQRVVRFRPKGNLPKYILYFMVEKPVKYFESTIVGTTVAHLSARDLKSVNVIYPSENILRKSQEIFEPIFQKEINLLVKNSLLQKTRDLLLPKLISGEVDVSHFPAIENL